MYNALWVVLKQFFKLGNIAVQMKAGKKGIQFQRLGCAIAFYQRRVDGNFNMVEVVHNVVGK